MLGQFFIVWILVPISVLILDNISGLRSSPVPDVYADHGAGTAIRTFIFDLSYQFTVIFVFAAIISGVQKSYVH